MSDSEAPELKAGHPPAMKVGGKRVPLSKHVHEEKPEPVKAEDAEEVEKSSPNKTVVISGAEVKEKDVYSQEATRAIHNKPMPTHADIPSSHAPNMKTMLQQPRKQ